MESRRQNRQSCGDEMDALLEGPEEYIVLTRDQFFLLRQRPQHIQLIATWSIGPPSSGEPRPATTCEWRCGAGPACSRRWKKFGPTSHSHGPRSPSRQGQPRTFWLNRGNRLVRAWTRPLPGVEPAQNRLQRLGHHRRLVPPVPGRISGQPAGQVGVQADHLPDSTRRLDRRYLPCLFHRHVCSPMQPGEWVSGRLNYRRSEAGGGNSIRPGPAPGRGVEVMP